MPGFITDERIPNNVDLSSDKRLQRALEKWQPAFLEWWGEMGPEGFQGNDVFLRTAISVESGGWAHFDYVKMPEYRWGIFLEPRTKDRKIHFGDHAGEDVWQTVPGEYRNMLRRIIVTQGDTEPASVEQQRLLGQTAPSLYDLRNLFQVNVEEGRHLWAMVYLLHSYFGRDGREEADFMLERRSGDEDSPRILGTFNEPIDDWLSFFCFTMFTDRDGKYQLAALAESGFDPLARTCRFMLTEEAHHMFVGDTGVNRVIARTAQIIADMGDHKVESEGAISLEIIQKYVNFWFSCSIDLFGGEQSSNAADFFGAGLKGRYKEDRYEDHSALGQVYELQKPTAEGAWTTDEIPMRNAMNEVLRDNYTTDCQKGVDRWNKTLAKFGLDQRITLPDKKFHRQIGLYAGMHVAPNGNIIDEATWNANRDKWLPTKAETEYVKSLMKPVYEAGKIASWIAPPRKGIHGEAFEMEYVRL